MKPYKVYTKSNQGFGLDYSVRRIVANYVSVPLLR